MGRSAPESNPGASGAVPAQAPEDVATLLAELHRTVNRLSRCGSVYEICRLAVEAGCERLGFERLGIWFLRGDPERACGTYGIDEDGRLRDERESCVTITPGSLAGQVVRAQCALVVREDAPILNNEARAVGQGTHAIAALWNGEEVIGFVSADNFLRHSPFSRERGELLALYASALGHLCTRKRLEEELQERAEALAEADRRKDEFLATLAHELRNPLATLRNAAHLLRTLSDGDPRRARAVDVVNRQVARLARMVDDLLDVSRVARGSVRLDLRELDLRGVIRAGVESCRPELETRDQSVAAALPCDPVLLTGDPHRLEKVIVNLLSNASKFSPRGARIEVTLHIESETRRREEPATPPRAVLRVRDPGIGIDPGMLSRIFDLFVQADPHAEGAHGGLGIGLTLVRRLVEMHGGDVRAASEGPGRGAELCVRLPVRP